MYMEPHIFRDKFCFHFNPFVSYAPLKVQCRSFSQLSANADAVLVPTQTNTTHPSRAWRFLSPVLSFCHRPVPSLNTQSPNLLKAVIFPPILAFTRTPKPSLTTIDEAARNGRHSDIIVSILGKKTLLLCIKKIFSSIVSAP